MQRRIHFVTVPALGRYFSVVILISFTLFLSSCSSTPPVQKNKISPPKKTVPHVVVAKPLLPEGWADITSRAKIPQIKQWIVNRNYSATMVLRELQTDSATFRLLMNEEMIFIAGISLRRKVPQDDPDFRVTRVPATADVKRKNASYAYSERGLLRRVVVFQKQNRIMELELMQEQAGAPFDELTEDLMEFAAIIFDR